MALQTVTEVRTQVETGLTDAALQKVMDGAEDDIDQRYGVVSAQTDVITGKEKFLFLTRPFTSITSVTERIGTTDTTLASNDYESSGSQQLERVGTGTNSRLLWGDRVTVVYVPVDTTNRRIQLWIRLIKLDLEFNGLESDRSGDFSSKMLDYHSEREHILSGLRQHGNFA